MRHIESDEGLCHQFNVECESADDYDFMVCDGGSEIFTAEEGDIALIDHNDEEDEDDGYFNPLQSQYEYELLRAFHMKIIEGKVSSVTP